MLMIIDQKMSLARLISSGARCLGFCAKIFCFDLRWFATDAGVFGLRTLIFRLRKRGCARRLDSKVTNNRERRPRTKDEKPHAILPRPRIDYSRRLMMLRSLVLSLLLLLALSAANCTSTTKTTNGNISKPAATSTPDAFAASRAGYMKNCKECHGEKGDGGPVKLEDGTKLKVPSLR